MIAHFLNVEYSISVHWTIHSTKTTRMPRVRQALIVTDYRMIAKQVREIIIQLSKSAEVGHIGSCLSIVEILVALYWGVVSIEDPGDPDRDRFVLSKGHAALAFYAVLHLKGWLSAELLNSFHSNGTLLGVHPEHALPGVDFSAGSLGMGLSFACGAAMAARMEGSSRRAFVLVSDAECNEGSLWESVMFAAHRRLGNLVAIVDLNGQQALGYTRDVLNISPMEERWRSFGWDVHSVDGHDMKSIADTIEGLCWDNDKPHVLIAKTTFGKGVSFMENQIRWHYISMSDDDFRQALVEIDRTV